MDIESRLSLIREVGEEIITEQDLRALLETKKSPVAYDGFEPSGKIHIAQGILRAINVDKMVKAGCRFKLLVADWHAWANGKFGGDLRKIRKAGEYMAEVWKATGMDLGKVEFVNASQLVDKKEYWERVMKIALNSTLQRTIRCSQIMGRSESELMHASQVFYPCMQAADIFELGADICQLGMDQRKVNVFAREIAEKLDWQKPVAVHHHMLMGLSQPTSSLEGADRAIELKMSKSKPDSAIFMTDSPGEVARKIAKAYCPEKTVQDNPVLEYCKYIIFGKFPEVEIERPQKFGGNVSYTSYPALEGDFVAGKLHPMDLKNATAKHVNLLLEPVRRHFEKSAKAAKLLAEAGMY